MEVGERAACSGGRRLDHRGCEAEDRRLNARRAMRAATGAMVGTYPTIQLLVSWVGLSMLPAHPIPWTYPGGAGRLDEGLGESTSFPLTAPPRSCHLCC